MRQLWLVLLCAFLLASVTCAKLSAQESNLSHDVTPAATATGPATALRDLLAAACSHDEPEFRKFLTARNSESFSRLTSTARTELMKRFVLLADPGKPTTSANAAGRPIVNCATPYGTAEMQIGGTELHDAIAFLPLDLREASDPESGNSHHILMGMVREGGSWKVLSLGLLLLDLPSLEVEWDKAEISSSEKEALAALRSLAAAVETYRRTYSHLPESLEKLAAPKKGASSANAAGLLDAELASGNKNGYAFRFVIAGANDVGAPAQYELAATPLAYGRTGNLSYFRDASGIFHAGDHQGAIGSAADPKLQ